MSLTSPTALPRRCAVAAAALALAVTEIILRTPRIGEWIPVINIDPHTAAPVSSGFFTPDRELLWRLAGADEYARAFEQHPNRDRLMSEDGIHISGEGILVTAQEIMQFIMANDVLVKNTPTDKVVE